MDNTELIDRYLQNELTENEQLSFKGQLITDSLLTAELQLQQTIIAGIERAGLKSDFSKAIRRQQIIKRAIRITAAILAVVIAMLVYHHLVNKF
ncbi:MAG: hypothetical protein ABIU77_26245 [Ferruginibacter sp.]|jgi:hypothetical protein